MRRSTPGSLKKHLLSAARLASGNMLLVRLLWMQITFRMLSARLEALGKLAAALAAGQTGAA
eukprot:5717-Heterococcus_DN1.PRE.3